MVDIGIISSCGRYRYNKLLSGGYRYSKLLNELLVRWPAEHPVSGVNLTI